MGLMPIGGSFRGRDDDGPPSGCSHSDPADLLRLIRELAPYVGIRGNEYDECVWCGSEDYSIHKSDCAWAKAQKVLKEVRL
jgi:hypothetical protein